MRILVAGATGSIGRPLCGEFVRSGHRVTALSRDASRASESLPRGVATIAWTDAKFAQTVQESDAIINLAGVSIGAGRWTPDFKASLKNSRIDATRTLVDAMRQSGREDQVLVNASAVGYYGDQGSRDVTEEARPGAGFLSELCAEWEAEALKSEEFGSRVALARTGPVLSEEGGMLERLIPIFKLGLGGPMGSGKQWLPWIHMADVVRMYVWMVETTAARGPFNMTAPGPVTNGGFARALGRALRRPALLPAPAFMLRIVLGEFAESILTGQKALPRAAHKLGFDWTYPTLDSALRSIFERGEKSE